VNHREGEVKEFEFKINPTTMERNVCLKKQTAIPRDIVKSPRFDN